MARLSSLCSFRIASHLRDCSASQVQSPCPNVALEWGGDLVQRLGGDGPLPNAPSPVSLLLSAATHPHLKAVALSMPLCALVSPGSCFSVIPPAFCLLGIPHNFWLPQGTPSSFFCGYLFCPSWENWKQMCTVVTWPNLLYLRLVKYQQELNPCNSFLCNKEV